MAQPDGLSLRPYQQHDVAALRAAYAAGARAHGYKSGWIAHFLREQAERLGGAA
jgi:hypothetical protein